MTYPLTGNNRRKGVVMNKNNGNGKKPNVLGGLYGVFFMSVWVFGSFSMGAPWWFSALGVPALVTMVFATFNEWKNHRKNKGSGTDGYNYTSNGSEDPWDVSWPESRNENSQPADSYHTDSQCTDGQYGYYGDVPAPGGKNFCPYCGVQRQPDYEFCGNCGRQLPD